MHSFSSFDIGTLRKEGKLDEAYQIAIQCFQINQNDYWVQSQFGWVIYELLKRAVHKKETEKLTPSQMNSYLDEYLEQYARLTKLKRPDLLHSLILNQLLKGGRDWPRLLKFLRWWNPIFLRDEDYSNFKLDDGKEIISLFLRLIYAISRSVVHDFNNCDSEIIEWANQNLDSALLHYPNDQWLHYYKSKILLLQGCFKTAYDQLRPVIKRNINSSWVWSALGYILENDDRVNAILCYQYAISISPNPVMILKTQENLASLLALSGRFSEAAKYVNDALTLREHEGFKIPEILLQLKNSDWYSRSNVESSPIKIEDLRDQVFSLLDANIERVVKLGVLEHHNPQKEFAYVLFSYNSNGVKFKYNKFKKINKLPTGTLLDVTLDISNDKNGHGLLIDYKVSKKSSIPGFYEKKSGLLQQISNKAYGFIRTECGNDVFVNPIHMHSLNIYVNKEISCYAILEDKNGRLGWSFLKIDN